MNSARYCNALRSEATRWSNVHSPLYAVFSNDSDDVTEEFVRMNQFHIASLFGVSLPPQLALLLTLALIVFLFRRDIREKPDVSGALWLPLLWMVITCSRGFTGWLNIFGLPVSGAASVEEGSPLDACCYLAMAIAGFCVLANRQISLSEVFRNNGWLIAFFLYCFISIAWSDFPFIAFKRWTKIFGHPIMALIVLTEPNPHEALRRLMKRCAYVVVPVSILWIKYYPQLGRGASPWGDMMNRGIATHKNLLGADCLILGFFFFWYLLQTWRTERNARRRNELRLIAGFLIGISWLLRQAHSATSTVCLFVAILIVVFVGIRSINKNFIGTYMLAALVLIGAAELLFGISGELSETLGRGSELSGRTVLWTRLLELQTNPIFGTGFESLWLGERLLRLEGIFFFTPDEAHNGYLEVYLNLGLIGVFLLIGVFVATFWKIRLELFRNFEWARYRLGFLAAVILYNWTEAAFRTFNPVCFVFYIIAMEYPRTHLTAARPPVGVARSEESREVAYAEGEP
jgi:exopolysaccharide production protein ExoQ